MDVLKRRLSIGHYVGRLIGIVGQSLEDGCRLLQGIHLCERLDGGVLEVGVAVVQVGNLRFDSLVPRPLRMTLNSLLDRFFQARIGDAILELGQTSCSRIVDVYRAAPGGCLSSAFVFWFSPAAIPFSSPA
jgi:hypothetical protein